MVQSERAAELRQAITVYQSLIDSYTCARDRMQGRKSCQGEIPVEVCIAEGQRTIDCLQSAVEAASRELKELVPEDAYVP